MLGSLQSVQPELSSSNGAVSSGQKHKSSNDYRRNRLRRNKLIYQKRKAVGLCGYGRCTNQAEGAHTLCQKHLRLVAERAKERLAQRRAQGLCTYCGERPQFWGRNCIICRQVFATDPLPFGARRALRLHREAEVKLVLKQKQREVAKLLATGRVEGKQAEALRLYMGLDKGRPRSYAEVGKLMKLSRERVRQLLLPFKLIQRSALRAPGRINLKRKKMDCTCDQSVSWSASACTG